jgi:YbbR domain-containing protein
MLATFTTISTLPIDITGLTESRKFSVELNLPLRISVTNPKPIEVEVLIQRSKP